MSGELEAAGAMATAGLAAGAIEGRAASEAGDGACLNCGAALNGGRYCGQCGQAAHPHRSLAHVFEEFLHGVLHFDTKAWRTVPMAIFRPGTLTRNYVMGKRARYISPLALFLFTIFFMFFVFAFFMPAAPVAAGAGVTPAQRAEAAQELETLRAQLAEAEREAGPETGGPGSAAAAALRGQVAAREAVLARIDTALAQRDTAIARVETGGADAAATDATWQDSVRRLAHDENAIQIDGMPELSARIRHKLENPDLLLYKVQQTAYKFSFLLAPLSLPFIALLFLWKRGVTLYDHMVYALYALSFASLLFVAMVLSAPVARWLADSLVLGLVVHTFFHLKGAYALGWWSALWRTVLMLFFAMIILMIFLVGIFLVGLLG